MRKEKKNSGAMDPALKQKYDEFIELWYKETLQKLFARANSILKNRFLAEEAVQDTFRIAWIKIEELYEHENPPGWLMDTLTNVLKNTRRKREIREMLLDDSEAYDMELENTGQWDDYTKIYMYALLDKPEYEILKLLAVEGYTFLDLTKHYNISMEACKKRVQRCRARFKEELKDYL